jgi:holo-[acyl-carrier protein] synthase
MKIFGVGTDLLEISRVQSVNIPLFAKKVLSAFEIVQFENSKNKTLFLAKKFCVKEAVAKAFGVGIGKSLSFKDITLSNDELGKPVCFVNKEISNKIANNEVLVHVSISDTKSLVLSYCVIELIA